MKEFDDLCIVADTLLDAHNMLNDAIDTLYADFQEKDEAVHAFREETERVFYDVRLGLTTPEEALVRLALILDSQNLDLLPERSRHMDSPPLCAPRMENDL